MENTSEGTDIQILEWFDRLCDLPREQAMSALAEVPESIREHVRAMLQADEADAEVNLSAVQWALAAELTQAEAVVPPTIPEVFGPYRIIARLGAGGMGRVYEAEQRMPRRRVALKVLHASGPGATNAAVAEAQALADVHHPSVPHVLDAGDRDGIAYIVMELVDGEQLRRWCEGRTLEERLRVMVEVCRGVHAAHGAGVLHRDIKPANIIVNAVGRPYILDFGLAGEEGHHRTAGTLAYLSRERLEGASATVASDVFALGVTLYEVVCGERPFEMASRPSFGGELRVRNAPVTPPSKRHVGDADLDAVVARALSVRSHRYPDAAALAEDLSAYLTHHPVSARQTGPGRRAMLWSRRHRAALQTGVLTAGAFLLAGAGLVLGVQWGQLESRNEVERLASQRLVELQSSLEEHYEEENWDLIEERLAVFVSDAAVRNTAAVARAWLSHHERLLAAGENPKARIYLGRAYLAARNDEERDESRAAVARLLRRERQWRALLLASADDPSEEGRATHALALAAVRQFHDAVEVVDPALRPLLQELSTARRTEHRPSTMTRTEFRGQPAFALLNQSVNTLFLAAEDSALTKRHAYPLPNVHYGHENPALVAGPEPVLMGFDDGTMAPLLLWRLGEDLEPIGQIDAGDSFLGGWTFADLDGDGDDELYYGTLAHERAFWRAVEVDGRWTREPVLDGQAWIGSDVESLHAVDLDGDGDDEIVMSTGLWEGYDLRIIDMKDGVAQVIHRLRGHGVPGIAFAEGPNGRMRLYVVFGNGLDWADLATSSRLRAGLRVLELDDAGALHEVAFVPSPMHGVLKAGRVVLGDYDGDGSVDAAIEVENTGADTWLVAFTEQGPKSTVLAQMVPMGSGQLDDDPADELLVRLTDDDYHLWVLGTGTESLPVWRPSEVETPLVSDVAVLDLLVFGFDVEAAEALRLRATLELSAADRARDQAAAAHLMAHEGRPHDAMTLFEEAAEILGDPEAFADEARTAAVEAHLDTPPSTVADFRAGELPSMRIRRPGQVRLTSEGLSLDAIGMEGVLVEFPIVVGGDGVGLEVDFTVAMAESGMKVVFDVVNATGERVHRIGFHTWGGNRAVDRMALCVRRNSNDTGRDYGIARSTVWRTTTHRLRSDLRGGEMLCELRREGEFRDLRRWPVEPIESGEYRIQIRAEPNDATHVAKRAMLDLHRMSMWGASLVDVEPDPHLDWAHGRLETALERADDPMHTLELLMSMGLTEQAIPYVDTLDPTQPEARRILLGGLKRDPMTWIPLVHQHLPDAFVDLYVEAWRSISEHRDRGVFQSLQHPFIDGLEPSTTDVAHMLFYRASLLMEEGHDARARRIMQRLLPVFDDVLAVETRFGLALLAHRDGDVDGAREMCADARKVDRWMRADNRILDNADLRAACGVEL